MILCLLLLFSLHFEMHGSLDSPMKHIYDVNTPIVMLPFDQVSK
jgi:hypothetical protein